MNTQDIGITVEQIDACTDKEELIRMKLEVEAAMVQIKGQIGNAKAKYIAGDDVDRAWFERAKGARRWHGYLQQKILIKEREITGKRKDENRSSFGNIFVDVARELLPKDQFAKLFNETSNRFNIVKQQNT
jgi:hypothetical protein